MEKVFGDLVPTLCAGTPSGRFASRTTQSVGTKMCVKFPSTDINKEECKLQFASGHCMLKLALQMGKLFNLHS